MDIAVRRREQEVWQACDDIWACSGDLKLLTGDAIRDRLVNLGKSRGSPNEIYKYRKTWAESRKVSAETGSQDAENDPISRAVRTVHEQLQTEAQEKIDSLQKDFLALQNAAEEKCARAEQDLQAVLGEFAVLKADLDSTRQELRNTANALSAEIEVRKAVETELKHHKTEALTQLQEKELARQELEKGHEREVALLNHGQQQVVLALESNIARVIEEKKALGQEYSEELNRQRVEILNLTIVKNESIVKLAQEHQKAEEIELRFARFQEIWEQTTNQLHYGQGQLAQAKEQEQQATKAHKQLQYKLTQTECKLARLRAMSR